jgi:hypothetical protein
MGEWRYNSNFLDLVTRWRWVVSFTTWPLYPRWKRARCPLIGGCVGPRASLDAVEKRKVSCFCRESNPGHPTHSQSLYRLSYPGYFRLNTSGYLLLLDICCGEYALEYKETRFLTQCSGTSSFHKYCTVFQPLLKTYKSATASRYSEDPGVETVRKSSGGGGWQPVGLSKDNRNLTTETAGRALLPW